MWFKKKIQRKVYQMYLNSTPTEFIAHHMGLALKDVDEIIDYLNEIHI